MSKLKSLEWQLKKQSELLERYRKHRFGNQDWLVKRLTDKIEKLKREIELEKMKQP